MTQFQKLPEGITSSLLIDADSLALIRDKLGWDIDIQKLVDALRLQYVMPRMVYFHTVNPGQVEVQQGYHKWLQYRGFDLVLRNPTRTWTPMGREAISTAIPVEIAMEASSSPHRCDHVVMLTRNQDLKAVGSGMRKAHRTLTVLSDKDCPSDLRCAATHFVCLNELEQDLARMSSRSVSSTIRFVDKEAFDDAQERKA